MTFHAHRHAHNRSLPLEECVKAAPCVFMLLLGIPLWPEHASLNAHIRRRSHYLPVVFSFRGLVYGWASSDQIHRKSCYSHLPFQGTAHTHCNRSTRCSGMSALGVLEEVFHVAIPGFFF